MRIIINGRAGSGKDVLADYLVDNYGFTKISFADGIYDIARDYFGMTTKDRRLLQTVGQKLREIDPDIWINRAIKKVEELGDKNVVISDCRQSNEYDIMVHDYGFTPIRIKASPEIRKIRIWQRDGVEPDMSLLETKGETGADNKEYTYEIINEDDLESLYEKIDTIISLEMIENSQKDMFTNHSIDSLPPLNSHYASEYDMHMSLKVRSALMTYIIEGLEDALFLYHSECIDTMDKISEKVEEEIDRIYYILSEIKDDYKF